eukprot:TRINITY_DN7876_c0_g1_i1.p1 TRINITY_DN7876_c0_g1~~TRINITY_DN7876_c0_g1_i1.p1  ORF type:complete len:154 (-),score=29.55 TRINITY_DN7876_c0_g1_i1:57-518(-)
MDQPDKTVPFSFEKAKKAVCYIKFIDEDNCGSGFFVQIYGLFGIMTNHHVMNKISQKRSAIFYYKEKKEFEVKIKPEVFFYTNPMKKGGLDATFVACEHEKIEAQKIKPINLTSWVNPNKGDLIHIYQHPLGQKEKIVTTIEVFISENKKEKK